LPALLGYIAIFIFEMERYKGNSRIQYQY